MFLKNILKIYSRVMPSSKRQINDKAIELNRALNKSTNTIVHELENIRQIQDKVENKIDNHISKSNEIQNKFQCDVENEIDILKTSMESYIKNEELNITRNILDSIELKSISQEVKSLHNEIDFLKKQIHLMDLQEKKIHRATNEAVWAEVFHDAIINSEWLKNQTFYPGRWAAGYPYLYALYRCLNEMHPISILELGLGQTTRVIAQYASQNKCSHIVTEHDKEWIEFFEKDFLLSENTEIMQLNIKKRIYDGGNEVTVYDNFENAMKGKKFDLISIDAPFGGATLEYSRIDILSILPECLMESFVILLDDYDRKGEKHMIEQLKSILEVNNIAYATGLYWGNKDSLMITSENMKFLCTM